jgi:hypothetical protein
VKPDEITVEHEHDAAKNPDNAGRDIRRPAKVLRLVVRVFGAVSLLGLGAFCVFGFLASFEPGNGLTWKVVYAAFACCFIAGAVAVLRWGETAAKHGGLNR